MHTVCDVLAPPDLSFGGADAGRWVFTLPGSSLVGWCGAGGHAGWRVRCDTA